jgi:hypothetical protein
VAKSLCPIAAEEVILKFDDSCIARLASIGKLPVHADKQRFAESVRVSARIYARDAREPNENELHAEIATLHRAAEQHDYERVAKLLAVLTPRSRERLSDRGKQLGFELGAPTSEALSDTALRDEACTAVARLCRAGGGYVEGRLRPSGRRSQTWRWVLHAPQPRRHSAKREAELGFVMNLRLAWLESSGGSPSRTAHRTNPGPFAKLAQECLALVGAKHANAINLINELDRRGKIMNSRGATDCRLSPINR